jgi:hypothetical protein
MTTATTSIFHQIEQVKEDILSSLGSEPQPNRRRRGLINLVGRIAKVLFGVCSDEDASFLYKSVSELSYTSKNTLDLTASQARIVRATIADVNAILAPLLQSRRDSDTSMRRLYDKIDRAQTEMSELEVREILVERVTVINLLLTQQAFEIQRLLHIVNSAIHGQIHPNLMTHTQYKLHLKEILLSLPSGLSLPFSLEKLTIAKLIQISQVSVILVDNTLIFVQTIPLINSNKFESYRTIPIPVHKQKDVYAIYTFVDPILGLSVNREYYVILSEKQLESCKHVDNDFYCSQLMTMYTSTNTICSLEFLLGHIEKPNVCKIKYVEITGSIFNRLGNANNHWIYVARNESIAIKCSKEEPTNIILNGVGQLTLNPGCKAYTQQAILIPSQEFSNNISLAPHIPFIETHPVITNLTGCPCVIR